MGELCDWRDSGKCRADGASVTPETTESFRSFFRLRDLVGNAEPEAIFRAMASTAAFAFRQSQLPTWENDVLLAELQQSTALWMGLLCHLATIDKSFFYLARRMAAATLVKQEPLAMVYRRMAGTLLVSDPPVQSKPRIARDVSMLIGVAVSQELGWMPTETEKTGTMNRSGCGRMSELLQRRHEISVGYAAIEKVWKDRHTRLVEAGFSECEVSDFFRMTSPMK